MKNIEIRNPQQLLEVIPLIHEERDRETCEAFRKVWSITLRSKPERAMKFTACIEITRRAVLKMSNDMGREYVVPVHRDRARELLHENQ